MMGNDYQVDATEDLNADNEGQYRAITIAGLLADNVSESVGILQNKPKSGEDGALRYFGQSRFQAGGAVAAGASLTIANSGYITTAAAPSSGSTTEVIGKCVVAVASGGIGQGLFNFTNRTLVTLV